MNKIEINDTDALAEFIASLMLYNIKFSAYQRGSSFIVEIHKG